MPFPLVSVIVLNYNCKQFLYRCLSSLTKSNYPNYELIVVDNNSTDGSTEFVQNHFGHQKNLKLLQLSKNNGFSAGNNIGAKHAKGKYIVFLNPDTEVTPDWLNSLVDVLDSDSSIGVAQPKILLMDSNRFDTAGCFFTSCGLTVSRGYGEEDNGQYNRIIDIFFAKGAALIIRQDLWKQLGGFDDVFFTYYEETDLCWSVLKLGYRVVYIPDSVIYHAGGGVLNDVPYHLKYNEAKGRLIILTKNHSLSMFLLVFPVVLFLHFVNLTRYLIKRKKIYSLAIFNATLWGIRNFKKIWVIRQNSKLSIKLAIKCKSSNC